MSLSDEFFSQLVGNALDFAETAARELEPSPKYSLINFGAAVELFLKARLLSEHWALIIKNRTVALCADQGDLNYAQVSVKVMAVRGDAKLLWSKGEGCSSRIPFEQ